MEGKDWLDKLRNALSLNPRQKGADQWPDWYRKYAELPHQLAPGKQAFRELDVVVLDAETTGLNPRKDQLLSLGALRLRGHTIRLKECFEAYLPTPEELRDSTAVSVHGIVPNSLRYRYTDLTSLMEEFLAYLGEAVIVGHHIGFDVEMINRALAGLGAGPLKNRVLDTALLAQKIHPPGYWTPQGEYALDKLARRYKISLSDRHTALGDSYITAILLLKLLSRLSEKRGRDLLVEDVFG
ncbi:PolC-type DNA polymerase III [Lewinella sp. W8]|uniref:3'-5' exonuclease n=1 Tax=Lewinella sp. W8 TaxID=2528208 RepID=UPI001067A74C|nr:3'-5' exonuclease [Lewinella sp. W8]MTB51067.1 3'-5' exonuclease [Lewinella sp. W8]